MNLTYDDIVFNDEAVTNLIQYTKGSKALVICDSYVYELHKNTIIHDDCIFFNLEAIEENKTLAKAEEIYQVLITNNFSRSDYLITFGGGIIGDLGGYVASTYNRGMKLIHIPTTLLAQVDSSIGGKVAVNMEGFKNIIGNFYLPETIIINPLYLQTLDDRVYNDSFSEVVKYSIISEFDIDLLAEFDLTEVIKKCIAIKLAIVNEDPYDLGIRNILNYGHSLAHLIEKEYGYSHAKSVFQGMYMSSVIFDTPYITSYLKKCIDKFNIEIDYNLTLNLDNLTTDKKSSGNEIKEIVATKRNDVKIKQIDINDYKALYEARWIK